MKFAKFIWFGLSISEFDANFDAIVDVKKRGFFRVFNFLVEIFGLKVGDTVENCHDRISCWSVVFKRSVTYFDKKKLETKLRKGAFNDETRLPNATRESCEETT
jgi:hypothetical protein